MWNFSERKNIQSHNTKTTDSKWTTSRCNTMLTYITHLNFVADQVHPLTVPSDGSDPPKQDKEPFYCKNCSQMTQRMWKVCQDLNQASEFPSYRSDRVSVGCLDPWMLPDTTGVLIPQWGVWSLIHTLSSTVCNCSRTSHGWSTWLEFWGIFQNTMKFLSFSTVKEHKLIVKITVR